VAVPLLSEGEVLGVLNLESRQRHAYAAGHVRTLSVLAQQAAAVLRTAQLHAEARHLAATDPLTGLYNRRHFIGQLEDQLRRVQRYPEALAVVLLDVDNLKPLNDSYGHPAGDQALLAVARAMQEWVRGSDQVARLGGDEFAALLLRSDAVQALQVVERLRQVVEHLVLEAPGGVATVRLTFSAGIALCPADGVSTQALLSRADVALYAAKRAGKNQVVVAQHAALGAETL
jgi:diguanylate cyclase (GGDEF)-like protein